MAELRDIRAPRKKDKKNLISRRPHKTQKGVKRTTSREQAIKLNSEKLERVVNRIQKTKAEKRLSMLSMNQLSKIADRLGLDGLSNLRKGDIIILIVREYEGKV